MASTYPVTLDNFATTRADATPNATTQAADHNNYADAINKIEAELGTAPSAAHATVTARFAAIQDATDVYSLTGVDADRTINVDSTTLNELLNVVGTLIQDLKDRGIVG
jgi:hypothetical protein